jgi:thioredoxin 1
MADNEKNEQNAAAHGPISVVTDENFIQEVVESGEPVLVDFYADWCGPCKMMSPIIAELAPEYEGKLKFVKLDTDANPGVSSALQIQSIPTFMIFKGNTVYAIVPGAMHRQDFQSWIDEGLGHIEEHAAELAAEAAAEQPATEQATEQTQA